MPRFTIPTKEHSKERHETYYYECWSCGQPSNTHCGPANPADGEVSICLNCTDPSVFTATGALRQPSPEEHAGIIADPEYQTFANVIRAANRRAMQMPPRVPIEDNHG